MVDRFATEEMLCSRRSMVHVSTVHYSLELCRGCGRFFGPAMRPTPSFSVLHWTHPAQPLLELYLAAVSQVSQIPFEHAQNLGGRFARPAAMLEEPVIELSEEAFHRRVVGAAPLLQH